MSLLSLNRQFDLILYILIGNPLVLLTSLDEGDCPQGSKFNILSLLISNLWEGFVVYLEDSTINRLNLKYAQSA